MRCPICGNEMQKGYLKSAKPIFWSTKRKITLLPCKEDVKVSTPDEWQGCYQETFYCAQCGKFLLDLHTRKGECV